MQWTQLEAARDHTVHRHCQACDQLVLETAAMAMRLRTGWWRLLAATVVLVAMVAWSRYFLALSEERFRWERLCAMACPPYAVSQKARDATRRASDWEKPLALALAPWGCGLAVGVRRLRRR